jgi:hypothetical protein
MASVIFIVFCVTLSNRAAGAAQPTQAQGRQSSARVAAGRRRRRSATGCYCCERVLPTGGGHRARSTTARPSQLPHLHGGNAVTDLLEAGSDLQQQQHRHNRRGRASARTRQILLGRAFAAWSPRCAGLAAPTQPVGSPAPNTPPPGDNWALGKHPHTQCLPPITAHAPDVRQRAHCAALATPHC